jgi:hypothetical protein
MTPILSSIVITLALTFVGMLRARDKLRAMHSEIDPFE